MDQRLKEIADNFDRMKIGLDTPFKFQSKDFWPQFVENTKFIQEMMKLVPAA